jgi:hypothetical protein
MLATKLMQGRSVVPSEAATIDMADYFPGRLAKTHLLRAVDGRFYHFAGDTVGGLWVRSLDPGYTDFHVWGPDGMYYFGWETPGGFYWWVPPELVFPRYWDPAHPWTRTFTYRTASITAAGDVMKSSQMTITMARGTERGEEMISANGVDPDGNGEHWWMSHCIPVRGGGCAPGIRGYYMVDGGVVTGSGEFVEWVPRERH